MSVVTDNTVPKQFEPFAWKPGQSGNPSGRPKGARNKLAESFLADLQAEWDKHGAVAISDMREKNPGDFCKMVASLLPREATLNLNHNEAEELSDDEIRDRLGRLAAAVSAILDGGNGNADRRLEAPRGIEAPTDLH